MYPPQIDREIVRQIFVDNGFSPRYYRFQRDLDVTLDPSGHVTAFALPIQSSCNLARVLQLRSLQALTLKKTWQSRVPVSGLSVLRDHPALERVIFESVIFRDPAILGQLNTRQIRGLSLRFVQFAAWETLTQFSSLEELELHLRNPVNWAAVCGLTSLRALRVFYGGITSLAGIANLPLLETLVMMNNPRVTSVAELATLQSLKALHLSGTQASDLSPLAKLHSLTQLEWHGCPAPRYEAIATLSNLEILDLYQASVTDLDFLRPLTLLRDLTLEGTPVQDLTLLADVPTLRSLNASWTPVRAIGALSSLPHLRTLELNGCAILDLSPLASLPALEEISLIDARCGDLSLLARVPSLRKVHLRESRELATRHQVEHLRDSCPDIAIEIYPLG